MAEQSAVSVTNSRLRASLGTHAESTDLPANLVAIRDQMRIEANRVTRAYMQQIDAETRYRQLEAQFMRGLDIHQQNRNQTPAAPAIQVPVAPP